MATASAAVVLMDITKAVVVQFVHLSAASNSGDHARADRKRPSKGKSDPLLGLKGNVIINEADPGRYRRPAPLPRYRDQKENTRDYT